MSDAADLFTALTPPTVGNPAAADFYMRKHQAAFDERESQADQIANDQQANIAKMAKMLDETTAALRAARSNRSNLPLMALGAGMMSSTGNFGQQVGAGLRMMIPTIDAERRNDEDFEYKLANIAMQRAGLENAPLRERLAYLRALQQGDQAAIRAIETAQISTATTSASKTRTKVQKALQESMQEARRQFEAGNKEMYATPEEAQAEIERLFRQQIAIRRAGGLDIPDEVIDPIIKTGGGGNQPTPRQRKTFFDPPTDEAAFEIGLPPRPPGYIYDSVGPKDRAEIVKKQQEAWTKNTKDWDDETQTMMGLNQRLDEMEGILKKNPKVVGPQYGVPNKLLYNYSEDAQRLNALFKSVEINNFPKGQGAVSNAERELFSLAGPNMAINADANLQVINTMREVAKRNVEFRDFLSAYFNLYKTQDGAVSAWNHYVNGPGSIVKRTANGLVTNEDRIPWQEYFRSLHKTPPVKKATGGHISLGSEYD